MTKRILVPLDHDDHAVVPVVASLARGAGATVRLLRVIPVPRRDIRTGHTGRAIADADRKMASAERRALDDLAAVQAEFEGVPVERVVRFGDVVDEIAIEAEAFGADLVAVSDTRRHHISRAVSPTVADRVTRKIESAVLVVRD